MKEVVVGVYVKSLRMVWCAMFVLAGVTSIISFVWTKEISLERELETEQGFRYSEKREMTMDEETLKSESSL